MWDSRKKSRLIESLLLRIPIPVFYVASDYSDHWDVVDGIQRITSVYRFVKGEFPLTDLEYLINYNDKIYGDLPRFLQRRISETQLIVNVIEPGTPEEVKFNVFKRINTGGVSLTGQEIRHAMHRGPARDFLRDLANSKEFLQATGKSINSDRKADQECVLRFMAFRIDPWQSYDARDLDGYLGKTMRRINQLNEEQRARYRNDFVRSMDAAYKIFGADTFRKPRDTNGRKKPINRALFETWGVELASVSSNQIDHLIRNSEVVQREFKHLAMNDEEFDKAISVGTSAVSKVRKRFTAIKHLVEGILL